MDSRLKEVMKLGYDVMVECKGKGRVYEMTYEATARKVLPQNPTNDDIVNSFKTYHTVGDTLAEVGENLYQQIKSGKVF